MNRAQNDWLRQQRLAHRENRLLSDRERLLRQLPGAHDDDLRFQVFTDTQAWTQRAGKTTAELTARTAVTIDGRLSNIGKKAVYGALGSNAAGSCVKDCPLEQQG